jgi:flagellar protein FlaG
MYEVIVMSTNEISLGSIIDVGREVTSPERPVSDRPVKVAAEEVLPFEKSKEEEEELKKEDVEEVTKFLNESSDLFNLSLRFSVHDSTSRIVVSVTNADTEEVIRQIPAQEVLDLAERLNEMVGVLFNETA